MDQDVRGAFRRWLASSAPEDACNLVKALYRVGERNFGRAGPVEQNYGALPAAEVWDLFNNRTVSFTRNQLTHIENELKAYFRVHNFQEHIQYAHLTGEDAQSAPNITHYYVGCWEVSLPRTTSEDETTFVPIFKIYYEEEPNIPWKGFPHIFGAEVLRNNDSRHRGPTNSVRITQLGLIPAGTNLLAQIIYSVLHGQQLVVRDIPRTPFQLENYRMLWVWDTRMPPDNSENGWSVIET